MIGKLLMSFFVSFFSPLFGFFCFFCFFSPSDPVRFSISCFFWSIDTHYHVFSFRLRSIILVSLPTLTNCQLDRLVLVLLLSMSRRQAVWGNNRLADICYLTAHCICLGNHWINRSAAGASGSASHLEPGSESGRKTYMVWFRLSGGCFEGR